jgi:hypothetical protein
VSEHNGAGAFAIEIGANSSTVFGGERDALLCGYERGQGEGEGHGAKDGHAGIIQRASSHLRFYRRTRVMLPHETLQRLYWNAKGSK